jgi:hypothetical protein
MMVITRSVITTRLIVVVVVFHLLLLDPISKRISMHLVGSRPLALEASKDHQMSLAWARASLVPATFRQEKPDPATASAVIRESALFS